MANVYVPGFENLPCGCIRRKHDSIMIKYCQRHDSPLKRANKETSDE